MREIEAIVSAYKEARGNKLPCVLATVVHVEGSSYRRAGARMLVDENGVMTGAISGGCLEGDALRKALHALHQNQNKLVTYDTSDEVDAVIGAQLGCNGVIQVLFEPIDFLKERNPVELLMEANEKQDLSIIATFFHLDRNEKQIGTELLIDQQLVMKGRLGNQRIEKQLLEDCKQAFESKTSLFREYAIEDEKQYVFLEAFSPPLTLVLVGAGNDAQVLAQMADVLGWEIIVTDGRPTHASTERFVGSCQVVVSRPEDTLEKVKITERTAFVLMTHNYQYDLAVFKILLEQKDVSYIGILGPKKKYQRMLDELKEDGVELSTDQLDKIYAPVGLEIGAETPAEIGLSILSEIQAVLTGTRGTPLKDKDGPIHRKKNIEFKQVTIES
ncbi:XdhC family protein [Ekhidna sp.]|uniref:XdhC family protein n=1 Tax=Ekhidna sp. TaxID=2608089 RepID=UPI003B591904